MSSPKEISHDDLDRAGRALMLLRASAWWAPPLPSGPELSLRGYPLAGGINPRTGLQAVFNWYNDDPEADPPIYNRAYVCGSISDHWKEGFRAPLSLLPFSVDFYVEALGRGQHFPVYTIAKYWDPANEYAEIDNIEIVLDKNNLGVGIIFSVGTHRPGGGATYIPDSVVAQADRIGKWHTSAVDMDGDDMVWTLNGTEVRREVNVRAGWEAQAAVQGHCVVAGWEIGGNWPGKPLSEAPASQPADPTTGTPWPCGVRLRNLIVGGQPAPLSGEAGGVINRQEWGDLLAAANWDAAAARAATPQRWIASLPFGHYPTEAQPTWFNAGDLRLYGNDEHASKSNDTWTGEGSTTIVNALAGEGWSDPYLIRVIGSDPPSSGNALITSDDDRLIAANGDVLIYGGPI